MQILLDSSQIQVSDIPQLQPDEVALDFFGYEPARPTTGDMVPNYYLDDQGTPHHVGVLRANATNASVQISFTDLAQHNGWTSMNLIVGGFGTVLLETWQESFGRYRTLANGTGLGAYFRDVVTNTGWCSLEISEG